MEWENVIHARPCGVTDSKQFPFSSGWVQKPGASNKEKIAFLSYYFSDRGGGCDGNNLSLFCNWLFCEKVQDQDGSRRGCLTLFLALSDNLVFFPAQQKLCSTEPGKVGLFCIHIAWWLWYNWLWLFFHVLETFRAFVNHTTLLQLDFYHYQYSDHLYLFSLVSIVCVYTL